jgi:hypothetical protein
VAVLNAPNQEALFYETACDAIAACVVAAGGFKRVASTLWPSSKPESAYARLKACLDDGKAEKLTAEEIIGIAKLAKEQGCHAWAQFIGAELGYEIRPMDPADEATDLQNKFIEAVRLSSQIAERLERLGVKGR